MSFTFAELFAGIGGFRTALEPLGGICVFASEIDKYATKAYRAIHTGDELQGDITKIDATAIPDHDLLVAGFPCQSFSVAGHQKGFEDARGTLFFEVARIAAEKKPKTMLLENVKGLISHDNGKTLKIMLQMLDSIGYAVDFTVLNSKYFGVPQNRERIFILCSRDATHQAWDIGGNGMLAKAKKTLSALGIRTFNFKWPQNDAVTTRLRDVLESRVAENYYLSNDKTAKLLAQLNERQSKTPFIIDTKSPDAIREYHNYCPTLQASDYKEPKQVVEGEIEVLGRVDINGHDILRRVYGIDGIAPTLNSMGGGSREPKIAIECVGNVNPSQRGMNGFVFSEDGLSPTLTINKGEGPKILTADEVPKWIPLPNEINRTLRDGGKSTLTSKHNWDHIAEEIGCSLRTRSYRDQEQQLEVRDEPISNTVTSVAKDAMVLEVLPVLTPEYDYRIRKLTPLECFRLQGFSDKQLWDAKNAGISDSQLYKQAGNAVTVNVITAIGESMVPFMAGTPQDDEERQLDVFELLHLKQDGAGQPYEYRGENAFNGEKKIPRKDEFD